MPSSLLASNSNYRGELKCQNKTFTSTNKNFLLEHLRWKRHIYAAKRGRTKSERLNERPRW